jgi:hypothetical protein
MTRRDRIGSLLVESVDGSALFRARLIDCSWSPEVEGYGCSKSESLRDLAEQIEEVEEQ